MGLDYRVTDDLDEFNVSHYARISYSQHPLDGIPFIQARSLLFEKGIGEQNIHIFEYEDLPVFYATGKHSLLPFDPFAATFFMISRYEEYMPYVSDTYGRFPATESFAFKNNFLHLPIVNMWAAKLGVVLSRLFPELQITPPPFSILPTIDIDNAWAYREKGITRTLGAIMQDISQSEYANLRRRLNTLAGREKDIYDTYDYMKTLHTEAKLGPVFFFLLGNYAQFDRNVAVSNRKFRSLIKSISDDFRVGIHPSFASNSDPEILHQEIDRLSNIVNMPVTLSRQHFLKIEFPQTFRNLLEFDIREDFSLGFADIPGFRAGTTVPFFFFDIDSEHETPLLLHPITVMDATLNNYMKLSPAEAILHAAKLKDTVKKYGGQFMPLWHNETLSEAFEWKGWRRVYEAVIKQ